MTGQLSAAEGAILRGADTVSSTREELRGRLKTLEGQIAAMGKGWDGPAAAAFHTLMGVWTASSRQVTDALEDFEANLRGSQQKYEATDSAEADVYTSIAHSLG